MTDIVKKLLEKRGVKDFEAFLNPSLKHLQSPSSLPGISEATEKILSIVIKNQKIVIFGDYDCDGICATAILVRTLNALGANVSPFLPRRIDEGYGMSQKSVARLLSEHGDVKLVVTVDNGINSIEQIDYLKSMAIDVIVTDHHLPGDSLPECICVNPKVASTLELSNLCGAGVALLLAQELVQTARCKKLYQGESIAAPLIVLAGLATVTDIMPILGHNRVLVSNALKLFSGSAPLGLRKLLEAASRTSLSTLNSRHFGFMIGPRINADGRLSDGMDALNLVLSNDPEQSFQFASKVDLKNKERKEIEQKMTEEAISKIVPNSPAQVIELDNGHKGVVGIVASRVLDYLKRRVPVCVVADGHGSARSPEGVNIRDAFCACREYLTNFGGHAAAGGFSVVENRVEDFRKALCEYAKNFAARDDAEDLAKSVDLVLSKRDVTVQLAEEIQQLEPFGEGNPEPVFLFENPEIENIKTSADGKHLFATINSFRAVWWNHGSEIDDVIAKTGGEIKISFTIEKSNFNGNTSVELRINDME